MIQVNEQTIQEFIKLLIEADGTHEVREDHTVYCKVTGQQITIALAKTEKPLAIWYSGAPCTTDVVWLNPFKELAGRYPEREWFFALLSLSVGRLTKLITMKVIDDCVKMTDDNYQEFALMSKVRSKVDEKTKEEVDKIGPAMFVSINYNKTKKTADAQTLLFDDQLKEAFPKIRKKTWEAIHEIFKTIYGDTQVPLEDFKYTSKNLNIPETEAKLNIVIALLTSLDPFATDILNQELHSAELQQHLEVLEGYAKLYEWAVVNRAEYPQQNINAGPAWNQTQAANVYTAPNPYAQPMPQYVQPQPQPVGMMSPYGPMPVPVTQAAGMTVAASPFGTANQPRGLFGV